jgi:hypothetical protein
MLAAGLVTTPDVAAFQTETQMDPGSPGLETFFATVRRVRCDVADLFEMDTGVSHEFLVVRGRPTSNIDTLAFEIVT